jgi:phosphatidylglycerophosphatase A
MNESRTPGQQAIVLFLSIGPLGFLPASGTVTVALIGVPLFLWMSTWRAAIYVVVTLVFTAASIWLHTLGDRILGEKDSRRLVWDELVGFMFAVAFVPFTWQLATIAFFCERVIDVAKVPPARWIERRCPGGWGVVGDDVVAGLYTCGLLHLLIAWCPSWVGLVS